jgi:hypothetical protein
METEKIGNREFRENISGDQKAETTGNHPSWLRTHAPINFRKLCSCGLERVSEGALRPASTGTRRCPNWVRLSSTEFEAYPGCV